MKNLLLLAVAALGLAAIGCDPAPRDDAKTPPAIGDNKLAKPDEGAK